MTKSHKARLDKLSRLPCVACVQEGVKQPFRTEIHHIVDKGYRKHSGGHDATIPLDTYHHRGVIPEGYSVSRAECVFGPSLALNKKAFVARYGSERKLLENVNKILEEPI